jgi:hypothetical protein
MPTYNGSSAITPIQGIFNNYPVRTFKPVNFAGLQGLTGMEAGDVAVIPGNGATFTYYGGWVQATPSRFSSTALRDGAYDTVGGAYRVAGAQAIVGAITYQYTGTAWKGWESAWTVYAPNISTNITLGTGGTAVFAWKFSAGQVKLKWKIRLGTGGSWNSPQFDLPVAAETDYLSYWTEVGMGVVDTTAGFWKVTANIVMPGGLLRLYNLGGTPAAFASITSASPTASAAGLTLSGTAEYTPA